MQGRKALSNFIIMVVRSLGTVSFVDPSHEDEYGRTVEKYENTYQMEPNTRFPVSEINCILQDVLKPLKDKQYDPEECKTMTKSLSDVSFLLFLSLQI